MTAGDYQVRVGVKNGLTTGSTAVTAKLCTNKATTTQLSTDVAWSALSTEIIAVGASRALHAALYQSPRGVVQPCKISGLSKHLDEQVRVMGLLCSMPGFNSSAANHGRALGRPQH